MRKQILMILLLAGAAAGLSLSPAAKADPGGCVTFCTEPNACGYVCCYQQCCGRICVDLDCAPPPPCPGDN